MILAITTFLEDYKTIITSLSTIVSYFGVKNWIWPFLKTLYKKLFDRKINRN